MSAPPAYTAPAAPPRTSSVTGSPRPLPIWVGHMDSPTAIIRAMRGGIKDGETLAFGEHKPVLGGELIELQYLRGFAVGVEKWKLQQPAAYELYRRMNIFPTPGQPAGVELGDHLIAVLDTTVQPPPLDIMDFFPHRWTPPAILPHPSARTRVMQPARHTSPLDGDFFVHTLPQIPLPEGVDRETLTISWSESQKSDLFNFRGFGCWIAVECSTSYPVHSSRTTEVTSKIGALLSPDEPALCIHQPIAIIPRYFGVIFAHGTHDQIQKLVLSKVLVTPEMRLFVFPNRPRRSTFVCTFESRCWSRRDGEAVTRSVRAALEGSAKVIAHCVDHNKIPDLIFSSIELEYVFDGQRHLWNVSMDPPSPARVAMKAWRYDISRLSPRDGNGGQMMTVKLECGTCGCCRHIDKLCPTGAYDEWTGASTA